MPLIRATFFFKDSGGYGWTETIHNAGADLTTVLPRALSLATTRRNMLGSTARLTFIRVSDDEVKRDSRVIQIPTGDQTARLGPDASSDIANTALVVRMETASPVKRRTLSMRGIPDGTVSNAGQYTPDGNFSNTFMLWESKLKTDGWSIRSRDGLQPPHNILTAVQAPTTGVVTITTGDDHDLELGKPLLITGSRGAPQINGTWIPFAIPSLTTFQIKITQLMGIYDGGGIVKKLGFVLNAITSAQVMRVSHRIAGRPFDSPVGRRRARSRL